MLLAPVHPRASPCPHCTSGDTPADSDRTAPQKGARRGLGRQTENNHRHEALVLCFVLFFWGGGRSCPNSFPHLQATCGDTMTIQTPALAFRLLEVRSRLLPKTPL